MLATCNFTFHKPNPACLSSPKIPTVTVSPLQPIEFTKLSSENTHGDFSLYNHNPLLGATKLENSPTFNSYIPKPSPYDHNLSSSFHLRLRHSHKTIKLSPSQRHITVTAISSSTGIESSVVGEDTTSLPDSVQVFNLSGKGIPISDL